ncbi:outer dynein arm-docking complex subunit 4-like [Amyelois transitella]|uniref:outer dynein arm-docking complex subunit 4-like n=1 Tax=Amyelois transitella TaxID=680683 RepID=UPI00067C4A6A|nr:outer dynein arm-docking complex subunit 4-like [Amyelois transitella]
MANLQMEEKQLYGALTVYRERGAYLRRLEQFEKAKDSYDEAFKSTPDDVRTLTGRSQVCADAVQPMQAYADADMALKLQPGNMNARNMQARAMYTMSDFERSVVMNFRGVRARRQPPYFIEGINQGVETIQDCIGENAGNVMLDFLPLIKQVEAARTDENEPQKILHVSRIPQPLRKKKLTQMEARKHLTLARVLAMKYLGPMAYDKFFLQELTEDKRIHSANAGGSLELKALVKEALRSLTERQEMLRSQRPYYTVKLAEKAESKYQNKYKEAILIKEREIGARTSERLLKQIEKCLRENRIMDLIAQAERMQIFLDGKTPRTLPDKEVYTDRLYRAVGEGYLAQHRLSYTLSERGNRRRIAFLMGLPVGRPTSFDSVMANYPYKFIDIKQATEKVMLTLEMCENSTMKCWLQYELARLLCTQKNYALAKFYAKRCQREAQELGNTTWWLNGCFVLMSGDMQQGNANEVRIQVEEAYEWSKKMQDPERVQAFLAKCAEMAAETVASDERKAIVQREKQIVAVLDDTLKVETEVLFKRMSTVPAGRRFAVLPRKPEPGQDKVERRKRRQRGLTIIPGQEKALPAPPKSKVLGFQLFDI